MDGSIDDDRTDALAFVHQIEGVIDLVQSQGVGDKGIDLDFAGHVTVDIAGELAAALDAAERRAAPHAAGYQLERTRADLLPGAGPPYEVALAPAAMAAFQCRAHHVDVADAFERIVDAAGQLHDYLLNGRVRIILGIDAIGRTHL